MMHLEDAKKLTQDKLTSAVIDEFRKDSLLELMVFDDNANLSGAQSLNYVYNRVSTLPTADFRAIGSEYTAQEMKTTQHTATLKVLGGSFEIDRIRITPRVCRNNLLICSSPSSRFHLLMSYFAGLSFHEIIFTSKSQPFAPGMLAIFSTISYLSFIFPSNKKTTNRL